MWYIIVIIEYNLDFCTSTPSYPLWGSTNGQLISLVLRSFLTVGTRNSDKKKSKWKLIAHG